MQASRELLRIGAGSVALEGLPYQARGNIDVFRRSYGGLEAMRTGCVWNRRGLGSA
jgi:hypothetical protein